MTAITHLAGNQIVVGNYAVQRCLLCGDLLGEYRTDMMMGICSDGSPPTIPMLSTGGLYEVDGNRTSLVSQTETPVFDSDLDLPDNCCLRVNKVGKK